MPRTFVAYCDEAVDALEARLNALDPAGDL